MSSSVTDVMKRAAAIHVQCRTCDHTYIAENTDFSVEGCYAGERESPYSTLIMAKESPFPFAAMPWGYFQRRTFFWKHLTPELRDEIITTLLVFKRLRIPRDLAYLCVEWVVTFNGRGLEWPEPCNCPNPYNAPFVYHGEVNNDRISYDNIMACTGPEKIQFRTI